MAFGLYVALAWSYRYGAPWVGYAVVGTALLVLGMLAVRGNFVRQKHRRERRWESALHDESTRKRAIRELSAHLAALGPRARATRARLSVLLAELHDAEGEYDLAVATVDAASCVGLSALDAGLVLHTRAVVHLRANDVEGALRALVSRAPTGDAELDARLDLLEAYAHSEQGDPERALGLVEAVEGRSGLDPSVKIEARVVRAAALDVQGHSGEARASLATLGRESLLALRALGQPRVQSLARAVLATGGDYSARCATGEAE